LAYAAHKIGSIGPIGSIEVYRGLGVYRVYRPRSPWRRDVCQPIIESHNSDTSGGNFQAYSYSTTVSMATIVYVTSANV